LENAIPSPHGGRLVSRNSRVPDVSGLYVFEVSADLRSDTENIADGIFSPLEGFLRRDDFDSVIRSGRLGNGLPWTVPIVLDADSEQANKMRDSGTVALAEGGQVFAKLTVEEVYPYDKAAFCQSIYGTLDMAHPGVAKVNGMKEYLVGGDIQVFDSKSGSIRKYRITPEESRKQIETRGWKSMVGFQTRNVPHVAHEMLQKAALNLYDGLFLNPLIGKKKAGDFKDEVILAAYRALIDNYYPSQRVMFATLHTEMRYAGPKEAIHHAIMRKNFGCSHFIVGRDHAGVGSYYHPFAAHEIFKDYPDIGIQPLFFPAFYYCNRCLAFANERNCPHGQEHREELSGTKMRKMVSSGEVPPKHLMRPEVAETIVSFAEPFV
jgi:sulfate adenylyltransferase